MGITVAKIRKGSQHYEVLVDMDEALAIKEGNSDFLNIEGDKVFTNSKKGDIASNAELEANFGTTDPVEIGKIIIKQGDVQVDQSHREEEKEQKIKQVVDFLSRNAIDPQSGRPITPERLKSALKDAHVVIKNTPVENQAQDIVAKIASIMPIKIEVKKIKVVIPAIHTGRAYGVISQYKERENWQNDGSLEAVLNIPAGIIMDFYDRLNSATQGTAISEDIKE